MEITKLIKVESSQIEAVGHNPVQNVLTVQFKRGGVYTYQNVTAEQHATMMAAESVGSWFSTNIKKFPEAHPYAKIA